MKLEQVPMKCIDANPFRNIEAYPIDREKVETIKESIQRNEWWENIRGRRVGDRIQIANGHHRRVALGELLKPSDTVGILVGPLTDEQMILEMAWENMKEWGTSVASQMETVRAVVIAYANGKVKLEKPLQGEHGHPRFAPSFLDRIVSENNSDFPYTAETIARFLGWKGTGTVRGGGERKAWSAQKVSGLLLMLATEEEGIVKPGALAPFTPTQAKHVLRGARTINARGGNRKKNARKVAVMVTEAKRVAKGEGGTEAIKAVVTRHTVKKSKGVPDINGFILKVGDTLEKAIAEVEAERAKFKLYICEEGVNAGTRNGWTNLLKKTIKKLDGWLEEDGGGR